VAGRIAVLLLGLTGFFVGKIQIPGLKIARARVLYTTVSGVVQKFLHIPPRTEPSLY
jgi:hypothetical protein